VQSLRAGQNSSLYLFQTASFLRFLSGESVDEAAASALNALDARALVNRVGVLGQAVEMSRAIFDPIRQSFRWQFPNGPMFAWHEAA
jgi:hypothetical protein